ncbi:MAG: HVO_0476 family zinc finger protein, partial [Thermoplasmata archaeon]
MVAPTPQAETTPRGGSPHPRLGRALLRCEVCAKETDHRILRVRGSGAELTGVARCAVCRTTRPFQLRSPSRVEVASILSDGGRSVRRRLSLPESLELGVGGSAPGAEPDLEIRRLDLPGGRQVSVARAREVETIWLKRRHSGVVRLSLIDGRRTVPLQLLCPPRSVFEVGTFLRVGNERVRVHAIRARGQTWEEPGARFTPAEVDRLYVRRVR